MTTQNARSVILACCVLHHFLREKQCETYCPRGLAVGLDNNGRVVDGAFRAEGDGNAIRRIYPSNQRNPAGDATEVRISLMKYFSNEGALPWQIAHVTRT